MQFKIPFIEYIITIKVETSNEALMRLVDDLAPKLSSSSGSMEVRRCKAIRIIKPEFSLKDAVEWVRENYYQ